MSSFDFASNFFDLIGLLVSLSALAIVVGSSSLLIGRVRRGFLALSWGLGLISFSFLYAIFSRNFELFGPGDLRPVFLSVGMICLLVSSHRLFYFRGKIQQPQQVSPVIPEPQPEI